MSKRAWLFFSVSLLSGCQQGGMNFDLEKALNMAKNVQKATKTIAEPEEIEIGSSVYFADTNDDGE